jgi:hypothetical protein
VLIGAIGPTPGVACITKIEVTLSQWRSVIAIPNLSLHFGLFHLVVS